MEINDALVTAITRELIKLIESGALSLGAPDKPVDKPAGCSCTKPVSRTPAAPALETSPCGLIEGSPTQGRKRVISEADIKRLCPASAGTGQVVEIGTRDIVTPLAEDYIFKMRITVNRVG